MTIEEFGEQLIFEKISNKKYIEYNDIKNIFLNKFDSLEKKYDKNYIRKDLKLLHQNISFKDIIWEFNKDNVAKVTIKQTGPQIKGTNRNINRALLLLLNVTGKIEEETGISFIRGVKSEWSFDYSIFNDKEVKRIFFNENDFVNALENWLHFQFDNALKKNEKYIDELFEKWNYKEKNIEYKDIKTQEIKNKKYFYLEEYEYYFVEQNISEYLAIIDELFNINKKNEKEKETVFYRGQINSNWDMCASIFRGNLIDYEKEIYLDIISKIPFSFRNNNAYEHLLTIQHFEGPTRLIDITQNPLSALFFAIYDENKSETNNDGIVFLIKEEFEKIKYFDSDKVQMVSNLAKMKKNFNPEYSSQLNYIAHNIRDYRPHFKDKIVKEDFYRTYVVKGIMTNERIENQNGDFIIVGMEKGNKTLPAKISQNNNIRIVINSNAKKNILKQLKTLDIHPGTMYPSTNKKINVIKEDWQDKVKLSKQQDS